MDGVPLVSWYYDALGYNRGSLGKCNGVTVPGPVLAAAGVADHVPVMDGHEDTMPAVRTFLEPSSAPRDGCGINVERDVRVRTWWLLMSFSVSRSPSTVGAGVARRVIHVTIIRPTGGDVVTGRL